MPPGTAGSPVPAHLVRHADAVGRSDPRVETDAGPAGPEGAPVTAQAKGVRASLASKLASDRFRPQSGDVARWILE